MNYPWGNDHISHQTGKGKSSTQKYLWEGICDRSQEGIGFDCCRISPHHQYVNSVKKRKLSLPTKKGNTELLELYLPNQYWSRPLNEVFCWVVLLGISMIVSDRQRVSGICQITLELCFFHLGVCVQFRGPEIHQFRFSTESFSAFPICICRLAPINFRRPFRDSNR